MNEASVQKLYQAIGIVSLTESFLDHRETMTITEIEFLQQSLSGAANLLSQVVEARENK